MRNSRMSVEMVGSMDSGGGTCLVLRDGRRLPIVVDCGGTPANRRVGHTTARIMKAVVDARPRFLAVSHFHYDHCGLVANILEAMECNKIRLPTLVSTIITFALMQGRVGPVKFQNKTDCIELILNKHSVPGSAGVLIQGRKTVFYSGDCYGMDLPDYFPAVDLLVMDCTGAMREAPRIDKEDQIRNNIMALISKTLSRDCYSNAYVALFSTQLERAAYLRNEVRKIAHIFPAVVGLSLFQNLNVFRNIYKGGVSRSRVALVTGVWAQGESGWLGEGASALVRISNGTHNCRLKEGDLVILSGSIPVWSNVLTRQIESMCRRLNDCGARVVVDTTAPESWEQFAERKEVHSSGHGNMPEIAGLIENIRPKLVLPFHASPEARARVKAFCRQKRISAVSNASLPVIEL